MNYQQLATAFFTQCPQSTPEELVQLLSNMGIEPDENQIHSEWKLIKVGWAIKQYHRNEEEKRNFNKIRDRYVTWMYSESVPANQNIARQKIRDHFGSGYTKEHITRVRKELEEGTLSYITPKNALEHIIYSMRGKPNVEEGKAKVILVEETLPEQTSQAESEQSQIFAKIEEQLTALQNPKVTNGQILEICSTLATQIQKGFENTAHTQALESIQDSLDSVEVAVLTPKALEVIQELSRVTETQFGVSHLNQEALTEQSQGIFEKLSLLQATLEESKKEEVTKLLPVISNSLRDLASRKNLSLSEIQSLLSKTLTEVQKNITESTNSVKESVELLHRKVVEGNLTQKESRQNLVENIALTVVELLEGSQKINTSETRIQALEANQKQLLAAFETQSEIIKQQSELLSQQSEVLAQIYERGLSNPPNQQGLLVSSLMEKGYEISINPTKKKG